MTLTQHNHGSIEIIELPTRLVMANAVETRNQLKAFVTQGRNRLILDLQHVEFIDSSGLSVLVSTLKAAQAEEGNVILLSPCDGVRSLIELTRLHQVFEIFEDKEGAIRRMS